MDTINRFEHWIAVTYTVNQHMEYFLYTSCRSREIGMKIIQRLTQQYHNSKIAYQFHLVGSNYKRISIYVNNSAKCKSIFFLDKNPCEGKDWILEDVNFRHNNELWKIESLI